MKNRGILTILGVALLVTGWCSLGWAKDAVQASVVAAPGATIEINGNPYSAGTYAVGTIRLTYAEAGSVWNSGDFTDFTMGIQIKEGSGSPTTSYPVTLHFSQTGSSNLQLAVTNCSDLTDASWDGSGSNLTLQSSSAKASCNVNVSVGDVDPALNYDGSELVGNLQMGTIPSGAHLDTVTTIQVKIKLVDPTTCLRLFNVITDFDSATEVNNLGIGAKNNGTIRNTSPNNLADAVYLVNTCSTDFYADLLLTLDPHFAPTPASPGHSVFFFTSESFDPDTETLGEALTDGAFVDAGSTQGSQNTCLGNQKIAANSALLIKVKNHLATEGISGLPVSNGFTGFSSAVFYPESGCTGSLDPDADPNPLNLSLPFSVN
jgi:hypothetical protein